MHLEWTFKLTSAKILYQKFIKMFWLIATVCWEELAHMSLWKIQKLLEMVLIHQMCKLMKAFLTRRKYYRRITNWFWYGREEQLWCAIVDRTPWFIEGTFFREVTYFLICWQNTTVLITSTWVITLIGQPGIELKANKAVIRIILRDCGN